MFPLHLFYHDLTNVMEKRPKREAAQFGFGEAVFFTDECREYSHIDGMIEIIRIIGLDRNTVEELVPHRRYILEDLFYDDLEIDGYIDMLHIPIVQQLNRPVPADITENVLTLQLRHLVGEHRAGLHANLVRYDILGDDIIRTVFHDINMGYAALLQTRLHRRRDAVSRAKKQFPIRMIQGFTDNEALRL